VVTARGSYVRSGAQTDWRLPARRRLELLLWVVQRVEVISEMVRNYHYSLRNDPEEGSSCEEPESVWDSDIKM